MASKTETKGKSGRKAVVDKDAPHGRDDEGKALAPFGYLPDGRPRATKLIDTDIDTDVLTNPFQPPAALQETASPKHARPERQRAMDDIVARNHQQWVDAGSPSQWLKLPTLMYAVKPEKAEGVRALIKRSADHLHFRPRFGSPTVCDPETCPACALVAQAVMAEAQNEGVTDPDQIAERVGAAVGGHELIVFGIVDKATKANGQTPAS